MSLGVHRASYSGCSWRRANYEDLNKLGRQLCTSLASIGPSKPPSQPEKTGPHRGRNRFVKTSLTSSANGGGGLSARSCIVNDAPCHHWGKDELRGNGRLPKTLRKTLQPKMYGRPQRRLCCRIHSWPRDAHPLPRRNLPKFYGSWNEARMPAPGVGLSLLLCLAVESIVFHGKPQNQAVEIRRLDAGP